MTATDERLAARLASVRLLSLDCDGVMTDGGLYYAADGTELRRFHVRDGVGIKALMAAGIEIAFITASRTPAIRHRAQALGVPHCLIGVEDKLTALSALCVRLGIALDAVGHVGDDVNDMPILESVGVPMTVADARAEVRALAVYTSERKGGDGAVREIADRIIAARVDAATPHPNPDVAVRPATSFHR